MPLPEKGRFTLKELAERWERSVEDVLRFGIDGYLKICTAPVLRPLHKAKEQYRGVWYDLYVLDSLQLIQIQKRGRTHLDNPFGACFTVEPSKYDKITIQDLFVLRDERDRFESEHQLVLAPNLPACTTTESAAAQIKID